MGDATTVFNQGLVLLRNNALRIAIVGLIITLVVLLVAPQSAKDNFYSVGEEVAAPTVSRVNQQQNHVTHNSNGGGARANRPWGYADTFNFVPNGIRRCQDLFQGQKYLVEPFLLAYQKFEEQTKKYDWIEGYSALRIEQYLSYIKVAESPFIRTVCETGFNAGHSTLAWLESNPRTHVYSFDLGEHDYAHEMSAWLQERYPGRLNLTWGDSSMTLTEFRKKHPEVKCDLIAVDGGHTRSICQSDFDNFKEMASLDNIVVLDNYPDTRLKWMEDLGGVWEGAKRKSELLEIFSCSFLPEDPHGFSVARYNL